MPGKKVYESAQQQRVPIEEPESPEARHCAVFFDDGDPHLDVDDEPEVQFADFDRSTALDEIISH